MTMSKSQRRAFIDGARVDKHFRNQFSTFETPAQILDCLRQHGFSFSDESRGRVIH